MRRIATLATVVVTSLSAWVAPASANDYPCDDGEVCIGLTCPGGWAWIWIDHDGVPHVDASDCVR